MTDSPAAGPTTVIVAFDFDKTLTRRDTVVPFLVEIIGWPRLAARLSKSAHRLVPAALRKRRNDLRAEASRLVFTGLPIAEVERSAAEFGHRVARTALRPDTLARLRWHQHAGHRVVVVSASYENYLRPVAAQLGIDHVIGTRLEVVDGRCTGRLDGPNCRGPEKVARLDAWMRAAGIQRSDVELWAYGDSNGDRELLAAADHATWVRSPLASVAPTSS